MTIADTPPVLQWAVGWLGGLTFVNVTSIVMAMFSFSKIRKEIAEIKRRQAVLDATNALWRQAVTMKGNVAAATVEDWAACLDDPLLVGDALRSLKAEKIEGTTLIQIPLSSKLGVERDRR
jgi:hypothetical protein